MSEEPARGGNVPQNGQASAFVVARDAAVDREGVDVIRRCGGGGEMLLEADQHLRGANVITSQAVHEVTDGEFELREPVRIAAAELRSHRAERDVEIASFGEPVGGCPDV